MTPELKTQKRYTSKSQIFAEMFHIKSINSLKAYNFGRGVSNLSHVYDSFVTFETGNKTSNTFTPHQEVITSFPSTGSVPSASSNHRPYRPKKVLRADWVQPLQAELSVLTHAIDAGTGASSSHFPPSGGQSQQDKLLERK